MADTTPKPDAESARDALSRLANLIDAAATNIGLNAVIAGRGGPKMAGTVEKMFNYADRLRSAAADIVDDNQTDADKAATRTTGTTSPTVGEKVQQARTATGRPSISRIDPAAPVASQVRQIRAHNAILDVATVGTDRICGAQETSRNVPGGLRNRLVAGPCVLREGHAQPGYDDDYPHHMDAEQLARAERYLIHAHPDPDQRA